VARTARAASADEAAAKAAEYRAPIALKIYSPDITHKSDVGGVALDLNGTDAVKIAADAMLVRVAKAAPKARLEGFVVQEMIRRPGAYELILGMADDATFGPFMLFGHGGTAVEVIGDKALGLPPLNLKLAQEMIQRTRIWHQLKGYRDRLPVALDAIALTLVQLSQLVCDFDEIAELDINPLLADERGVIAVDARIRVAPEALTAIPHCRLAIRPYPQELESLETIPGLGEFLMRPVRPEDAPAFTRLSARMAPEDVRLRFFSPFKTLPPVLLARLTQIDYDREMAFVLFDVQNEVAGVGRLSADPDGARAEFAVLSRSDLKGHGIGHLFMNRLIAYARARNIGQLFGDVLVENEPMLALCRELGFKISTPSHGVIRATLVL